MIVRRSAREIDCMREAGAIVAETLEVCRQMAVPGVTTGEIDARADACIRNAGATSLFKGYRGYPGNICVSVNEEVVHGIPGRRALKDGDALSVDVGVRLGGYCADAALTVPVGAWKPETTRLAQACRESLDRAIGVLKPGVSLSTVCRTIQLYVESQGYSVVRRYTGHGIGREMHEDPQVPNFFSRSMTDVTLPEGAVLAIEPMINAGRPEVEVLSNGWTVVTKDRTWSAHFEHTVAIRDGGPDILTLRRT